VSNRGLSPAQRDLLKDLVRALGAVDGRLAAGRIAEAREAVLSAFDELDRAQVPPEARALALRALDKLAASIERHGESS
jgi:hypothetical protein